MKSLAAWLLMIAAVSLSFSGIARAVPFDGQIMGMGGVENRQVLSIHGRKYHNLIQQQTDFSCGAAALATIMKYAYKLDVDEQKVLEGLFAVSDHDEVIARGFSLLDIKQYVERVGFRGRGYKVEPHTLDNIKIPTIVLLDMKGYKHFVVLKKTDGDDVYIADPALGNKIIDRETFHSQWNGIVFAVIGPGFDRNTVLVNPKPQLTARKLHDVRAPLTHTELLDYGFRFSELF